MTEKQAYERFFLNIFHKLSTLAMITTSLFALLWNFPIVATAQDEFPTYVQMGKIIYQEENDWTTRLSPKLKDEEKEFFTEHDTIKRAVELRRLSQPGENGEIQWEAIFNQAKLAEGPERNWSERFPHFSIALSKGLKIKDNQVHLKVLWKTQQPFETTEITLPLSKEMRNDTELEEKMMQTMRNPKDNQQWISRPNFVEEKMDYLSTSEINPDISPCTGAYRSIVHYLQVTTSLRTERLTYFHRFPQDPEWGKTHYFGIDRPETFSDKVSQFFSVQYTTGNQFAPYLSQNGELHMYFTTEVDEEYLDSTDGLKEKMVMAYFMGYNPMEECIRGILSTTNRSLFPRRNKIKLSPMKNMTATG